MEGGVPMEAALPRSNVEYVHSTSFSAEGLYPSVRHFFPTSLHLDGAEVESDSAFSACTD